MWKKYSLYINLLCLAITIIGLLTGQFFFLLLLLPLAFGRRTET